MFDQKRYFFVKNVTFFDQTSNFFFIKKVTFFYDLWANAGRWVRPQAPFFGQKVTFTKPPIIATIALRRWRQLLKRSCENDNCTLILFLFYCYCYDMFYRVYTICFLCLNISFNTCLFSQTHLADKGSHFCFKDC